MSRQSMAPSATLTLTQELERLEQQITLTLQEIDHNFSRAHRIVTSSILPVVEQYGKHSEAVWEGSKFWKQFFEASANVSLSGYEEPVQDDSTAHEETQESHLYDDETAEDTVTGATATPPRASSSHADEDYGDTSTLDSPSLPHAHSTPRAPHSGRKGEAEQTFREYSSPYEALKREMQAEGDEAPGMEPTTPGQTHVLPDMSMTPESSPFVMPTTTKKKLVIPDTKPLLHHVLDKTYRVQSTPHTARKQKPPAGRTPGTANRGRAALPRWTEDSSPMSSPAPQLRADIFSSPLKSALKAPRTPGVSVQTPAKKNIFDTNTRINHDRTTWESESEDEDDGIDFSPPKTMQFHIPQSRLLQTPAREASKRIVEDLLMTAGGDITDDFDQTEDDSPSVVRRNVELDDTF